MPYDKSQIEAIGSQQKKVLSVQTAQQIFVEFLTYDANNTQPMYSFVAQYPWVLTEPSICEAIVGDANCYNTLKLTGWWDQILAQLSRQDDLALFWLKRDHVLALAYEATDAQLEKSLDWPAWEILVQQHGPMYQAHERDPDIFYRTRAFVVLANRLGTELAPLMCATMGVLLPLDELEKTVGSAWTSLQKAQYAWLIQKTPSLQDIWPTPKDAKSALIQAQTDVCSYLQLAGPQDIMNLTIIHELCDSDLESTISKLIELAQESSSENSGYSLDYTHALDSSADQSI